VWCGNTEEQPLSRDVVAGVCTSPGPGLRFTVPRCGHKFGQQLPSDSLYLLLDVEIFIGLQFNSTQEYHRQRVARLVMYDLCTCHHWCQLHPP
jgi:hypothetical protein